MSKATSDYPWSAIDAFNAEASAAAEPPAPAEPDVSQLSLDEFGEQRAALGIKSAEFIGLGPDQSGLPDWRTPVVEQVEITEMDEYGESRKASGIPDLNDFGLPTRTLRNNASPWRAV